MKRRNENAAEQKRKSDLQCNDVFYHGALDEYLQRNTSYGSVKPHNDPRGLDRIPDRLCVRDVPGLVCGLRTGEGLRVPFSCKAGELGTPQGDRGFLLHGGSDGHHHVPVRRA